MLISYNWLKEHCNLPAGLTPAELGDKFKMSVVEVEKIIDPGANLENIVVGKVLTAEKHPNADKLKVCDVDAGGETVRVVCGGSNVVAGMLVALAKVGSKVRWHGEGDLIELGETTIRGEKSFGMICASTEIGLGGMFPLKDEKEILDLTGLPLEPPLLKRGTGEADDGYPPLMKRGRGGVVGQPLAKVLNLTDSILEIDNKSLSHRPDLWGHRGLAREAAALYNREMKPAEFAKIKPGKKISVDVKVEDAKLCPRYMAVAISGVKVGPSPVWLQNKLLAVGLNPINNIVDITNYIMLDLGQPMHAFDASRLAAPSVIPMKIGISVRSAKTGETFVALDKKEYKLAETDLVIADADKPIAIAGVMGRLDSGVTDATETIIFESANFNPVAVRKTSTRLNLRSDSAQRFEKSLDPNNCELALAKAVVMTLELCPGAVVASNMADEKHFSLSTGPLTMPKTIFAKQLGVEIPLKQIVNILTKLGFEVKEKKDELSVKIPTWRATKDISIAADIVEEVGRIYGFSNIPGTLPTFPITPASLNPVQKLQRLARNILVHDLGYSEVYNYSFVSKAQITKLGDDETKYLELDNPISKEKPYVRRNLLPNLFENIANNISRVEGLKLFEIGKVFHADEAGERTEKNSNELLPRQDTYLTSVYINKKDETPFWGAKLVAETVGRVFNIDFEYAPASVRPLHTWQHPARTTWLKAAGIIVGRVYEVGQIVAEKFDCGGRVGLFSLNLTELADNLEKCQKNILYKSSSVYPEVKRDVAFVVNTKIVHADVVAALNRIDTLVVGAELFDVYAGKNLGVGKKSMAYRLTLLNPDRTLESKEADAVMDKATKMLMKNFGAEMRK